MLSVDCFTSTDHCIYRSAILYMNQNVTQKTSSRITRLRCLLWLEGQKWDSFQMSKTQSFAKIRAPANFLSIKQTSIATMFSSQISVSQKLNKKMFRSYLAFSSCECSLLKFWNRKIGVHEIDDQFSERSSWELLCFTVILV